jgi:hypothetical protein
VSRVVTILVAVGVIEAVVLGYTFGVDVAALSILGSLLAVGVLAIVVARKSEAGGVVGPVRCDECGGLISPNAPYCKHCGNRV